MKFFERKCENHESPRRFVCQLVQPLTHSGNIPTMWDVNNVLVDIECVLLLQVYTYSIYMESMYKYTCLRQHNKSHTAISPLESTHSVQTYTHTHTITGSRSLCRTNVFVWVFAACRMPHAVVDELARCLISSRPSEPHACCSIQRQR